MTDLSQNIDRSFSFLMEYFLGGIEKSNKYKTSLVWVSLSKSYYKITSFKEIFYEEGLNWDLPSIKYLGKQFGPIFQDIEIRCHYLKLTVYKISFY